MVLLLVSVTIHRFVVFSPSDRPLRKTVQLTESRYMLCQPSALLFWARRTSHAPSAVDDQHDADVYPIFEHAKSYCPARSLGSKSRHDNMSAGIGLPKGQILKQCVRRLVHKH